MLPVRQAAHLQRGSLRALHDGAAHRGDHPVVLVRFIEAPEAEQRRVAGGVHLDEHVGLVRIDELERGR
jgi:hypothetical protein